MNNVLRSSLSVAAIAATSMVFACSSKSGGGADEQAQDSADTAASNAQASHMGEIVFSGVTSQDPTMAANSVASGAGQLWPAGCVVRAKDATNPNVVHLTFNDCTGPFGLVHLSGEVIVTFSKNADGSLHAEHTSVNLTANGHPIAHSASADITVSGNTRNVKWHGAWTRLNARGETVAHTSDLTIVIDVSTHCRDSNGTAQTTVGDRQVDSTITDYKICRGAGGVDSCPSGTITHTFKLANKTVTIAFDGSNEATVTEPNGTVKVPLVCGG